MARTLFGGTPADVLEYVSADGDFAPVSAALTVWDSASGGTQLTDLQTFGGVAASTVTPEPGTYRIRFYGPDGFTAPVFVQDADGNRWQINPADLASRVGASAMTQSEALLGTGSTARTISASVLIAAIQSLAWSNVYFMPLWGGTGTQPTRPAGLPSGFTVVWLQPVAPPIGSTYAHTGDRWQTSA